MKTSKKLKLAGILDKLENRNSRDGVIVSNTFNKLFKQHKNLSREIAEVESNIPISTDLSPIFKEIILLKERGNNLTQIISDLNDKILKEIPAVKNGLDKEIRNQAEEFTRLLKSFENNLEDLRKKIKELEKELKKQLEIELRNLNRFLYGGGGIMPSAPLYNAGNAGSTFSLNLNNGLAGNKVYIKLTLTANSTFTIVAPNVTGKCEIRLEIIQGGSGSYSITWPSSVKFRRAQAYILSTVVGGTDSMQMTYDSSTGFYQVNGFQPTLS